jgi:hypothetical protein
MPSSMLLKQKFPLILLLTKCKAYRSYLFKKQFSLLPLLEKKSFRSYLFSLDPTLILGTELHKLSRVLQTKALDLHIEISKFQVRYSHIASSFSVPNNHNFSFSPNNGTICWHRGRPRFQCSRVHQQNPNYWPFWKHLRSR